MFCDNCGTELKDSAKFCHKCGKKVFVPGATTPAVNEPAEVVPEPAVPAAASASEPAAPVPEVETPVAEPATPVPEAAIPVAEPVVNVAEPVVSKPVHEEVAAPVAEPVTPVPEAAIPVPEPAAEYERTEILTAPEASAVSAAVPNANEDLKQATEQLFSKDQGGVTPPPVPGKKKGGKKALLTILLILIVLALAGVLTYLFVPAVNEKVSAVFTGKGNIESDEDTEETAKADKKDKKDEKDNEKKKSEKHKAGDEEESSEEVDVENKVFSGKRKPVDIQVRQVDNTNFPEVALYTNILDDSGNTVEDIKNEDLNVKEISKDGSIIDASISEVYRLMDQDKISINLVMDQSGSMYGDDKMGQAKNAAKGLVGKMSLTRGDQVEVISFDDYVYLKQEFTGQQDLLYSSIDAIEANGSTALFDALYAGLYQTNMETGAKCVIGFTDGAENASSYTYDDVVGLSRNTGIPVYLIGIGDGYDTSYLQRLASDCSGRYYSADNSNLETILEDIYVSIYREQQDYYVVKYKTTNTDNRFDFREVVLETSEQSQYEGTYTKEYVPETDVSSAKFGDYASKDFMIDDSDTRSVSDSDLAGMSLAELRIARNEIYARHGRQFKDPLLNQWFYSKTWYLNISNKYSPQSFDAIRPSPLSSLELANANYILEYEKDKMEREDIYPNASNTELAEYDLALSKPVLKKALSQLNGYSKTAILEDNKKKIEEALAQSEVSY